MFWILFLLLPLAVFANERNLSSDLPMEFDGKDNSLVARQNATFVDNSLMVVADEIRYSKDKDIATATGNVRLTFKGTRLVAEKLTYATATQSFTAENFRMGFFPYMITGESIEGTPKEFHLKKANIYGSQTGTMAPNVYMARLTLTPGEKSNKIKMHRALVKVGPVPVLPIPYVAARLPREWNVHMQTTVGNSNRFGTFVRTESLYPITDNLRVGANLDYYSKSGWLVGPRISYENENIKTFLDAGYISDNGKRGVDSRGIAIDKQRGYVDWKTKAQAGRVQVTNQVQYWSDSEILRDFRRDLYDKNQGPDTFTEAVLPLQDAYITLFVRSDPNNFDITPRTLPELRIDRLTTPLGDTGLYYSFYNSFSHNEIDEKSYNRYDGIFTLTRPFALKPWWQFTPVAAGRFTAYDDTQFGPSSANTSSNTTRLLGQIGFDSQWSFYRIWEVKSSLWDVDGLKHTFQPVVQYRYLPSAGAESANIPSIQGRVFDTNLRPTDFFYRADIDNPSSFNLLRFGAKQSLQTRNSKTGEFATRDLLTLELYQDYNISRTAERKHWDSFYILAEASPCPWLSVGLFGRASLQDGVWQEDRLYATLKDGDYRTLTFSTRFLKGDTEQYGVLFTQRLTDRLTLFADTTYDGRINRFSDLFYGVRQRLRSGWEAEYALQRRVNDSRESDTQFTFRFRWLSF